MSTSYIRLPPGGVPVYPSLSTFPASAPNGSLAVAGDTDTLYVYSSMLPGWEAIGGTSVPLGIGTYNSQPPSADGATITNNLLYMQAATTSDPGLVTIGNLTDAGTDGISITGGTGSVIGSGTAISQHVADATHNGYLSSTDWNTFNNKQPALTFGDLTDVGTDGITITGGTGAVIGSGTSLSQHVADASHNGYLSSTDWNTFNNKQPAGNYITALTGDVTASGPGSVAATLANTPRTVYVDVTNGSDSNTGSLVQPWKTLQHAYNSISPNINNPYTIFITGGNNDTDSNPITGKPNVSIVATVPMQIQGLTITGSTGTNDTCWFENLIFLHDFTWIRNDVNEIQLGFINCQFSGTVDFEQQGTGVSGTLLTVYGGALTGGLTAQVGQANITTQAVYGSVTFKEAGTAYYLINGADLYTTAVSITGGATLYIYGCSPDSGYSITGTSSGSGTPTIIADDGSLPPTISGAYSLVLNSLSQYVSYTPSISGNWNSIPSLVSSALDDLASSGVVKSQSANQVLASPNGSSGVPSFRSLVSTDIPSISLTSGVTGVLPIANGGTNNGSLAITAGGTLYTDGSKVANVGAGTSGQVLTSNGSSAPTWQTPSSSSPLIAYISDQKSSGTDGGSVTTGGWHTRDLNTLSDPNSIVTSLSGNQFTLPAGTYDIEATAPMFAVTNHQARIQNITDSSTAVLGSSEFAGASGTSAQTSSRMSGQFTIAGSKVFELQYQCAGTEASNGLGVATGFGTEIYSQIKITKH